ncbi:MAG: OsmC family peroxiredoxin, partial [Reyranellaceae bacterium]
MPEAAKTANNGVNVQHLIGAREALTATPAAAQFQWRATCEWKNGTHSHSTVENFFGLGAEQARKRTFRFDADHPEVFAAVVIGATP